MSRLGNITESLQVFGQPGYAVSTNGGQLLNALPGIIDGLAQVGGQLADSVTTQAARRKVEAEAKMREQAELDRYRAEQGEEAIKRAELMDKAEFGQWKLDTDAKLANVLQLIEEGDPGQAPLDGETSEQFVKRRVAEETNGMSPGAARLAAEDLTPKLASAYAKLGARTRKGSQEALKNAVAAAVASSRTPDSLVSNMDAAVAAGMSRAEAASEGLVAIRAIAESGRPENRKLLTDMAAVLGGVDGMFGDKIAEQFSQYEAKIENDKRERQSLAIESLNRALLDGIPAAVVAERAKEFVARGVVSSETGLEFVNKAQAAEKERLSQTTTTIQTQRALSLYDAASRGQISVEQFRNENEARTLLSSTDPNYLSPGDYSRILGRFEAKAEVDAAAVELEAIRAGTPGQATVERHGRLIDDAMRADGAISPTNNIANPTLLAGWTSQYGVVTPNTRSVIRSSLESSDMGEFSAGLETIARLEKLDPRRVSDLKIDDSMAPLVQIAREAADQRMFDTPEGRAAVAARATLMRQQIIDRGPPTADMMSRAASALSEYSGQPSKIMADHIQSLADELNKSDMREAIADPSGLFNSVDPDALPPALIARFEREYVDHFMAVAQHMPPEKAADAASRHVKASMSNSLDLVRFNGSAYSVVVDNGRGIRMPDQMRWSPQMEKDVNQFVKERAIDPQTIAAVQPLLDVSDPKYMGWVFIDENGYPIIGKNGGVVLFQPQTATQKANAAFAKEMAKRAETFGTRSVVDRMMDAFRPRSVDYPNMLEMVGNR